MTSGERERPCVTLTVSRDVPEHVGMLSTGLHGSHTISTGNVSGFIGSPYTTSYSPERTIYGVYTVYRAVSESVIVVCALYGDEGTS